MTPSCHAYVQLILTRIKNSQRVVTAGQPENVWSIHVLAIYRRDDELARSYHPRAIEQIEAAVCSGTKLKPIGLQPNRSDETVVAKLHMLDLVAGHRRSRIHSGNGHVAELFTFDDIEILDFKAGRNLVNDQGVSDFALRSNTDVHDDCVTGMKCFFGERVAISPVDRAGQLDLIVFGRRLLHGITQ